MLAAGRPLFLAGSSGRRDLDVALAAQRLEGVGQQVREQLPQLVRIALDRRQVRRDVERRRRPRRAALGSRPA